MDRLSLSIANRSIAVPRVLVHFSQTVAVHGFNDPHLTMAWFRQRLDREVLWPSDDEAELGGGGQCAAEAGHDGGETGHGGDESGHGGDESGHGSDEAGQCAGVKAVESDDQYAVDDQHAEDI